MKRPFVEGLIMTIAALLMVSVRCCFHPFWDHHPTELRLDSGKDFVCLRQPPAGSSPRIWQPLAETWVASGSSPRSISRRFWEGSGVGKLRPPTPLERPPFFKQGESLTTNAHPKVPQ